MSLYTYLKRNSNTLRCFTTLSIAFAIFINIYNLQVKMQDLPNILTKKI